MKHEGFTPGPWTVDDDRQIKRRGKPFLGFLMVVAERGGMPGVIINNGPITKQDEANARLIADAPNLLAQRDRLVEALERHLRYFEEADQQREGWKLMCLQTRALLDEIKG